jgi:carbonic anhydrase/acetyltransferase-like protein (isoleucine patch superfamily)
MIYALGDIAPEIASDAWVAPDANIIGRVRLGALSSVWFGSTLRGDNEALVIGPGTNVQDGCVFHTDMGYPLTIGRDCTIGHKAILHGCSIGDGTLVGMHATVLNGAQIGQECLIGAGALVTEGTEIPDRSLVFGSPARVVRRLDDDAVARLRAAALNYQERARLYRDRLRPL